VVNNPVKKEAALDPRKARKAKKSSTIRKYFKKFSGSARRSWR
jgi:hypothetical protein